MSAHTIRPGRGHVQPRALTSGSAIRISTLVFLICLGGATSAAAQFVVNESDDLFDFNISDGVCNVCREFDNSGSCTSVGGCTLVAAIQNANLSPDLNTISFTTNSVIIDERNTPAITGAINFDGTVGAGRVHVAAGPGPGSNGPGLLFTGPGSDVSSVRNMEISGFTNNIEFRDSSVGQVTGCYIHGSSPSGRGILAVGSSANLTIGGATPIPGAGPGNIIAGNGRGIELSGGGNNLVYGNLIGFDDAGQPSGNTSGITVSATGGAFTHIGSDNPDHRNVVSNSQFDGISVTGVQIFNGGSTNVEDLTIRGNYVGTDPTGLEAFGNLRGIVLTRTFEVQVGGDAPGEGNLVSGNTDGIWLNGRADSTLLIGNVVGLSSDGTALPNVNGIVIRDFARKNLVRKNIVSGNTGAGILVTKVNLMPSDNEIEENTIGLGANDEQRGNEIGIHVVNAASTLIGVSLGNTIASNDDHGILIEGAESTGNRVYFNQIGLAIDGTARGNGGNGIRIAGNATNTTIEANTIGLNDRDGIGLQGPGVDSTLITGNEIGLDFDDRRANNGYGIALRQTAANTIEGNVIGWNTVGGVLIEGGDSIDNKLFGNWIGTDPDDAEIGNEGPGVLVDLGTGNHIGGELDGQGNAISFNEKGVVIDRGNKNPILRNRIVSNVLAAIDLGDDLATANDSLDLDEGANDFQNFPEITSYIGTGDSTFVEGVLRASPAQNYRLEFFADSNGIDLRVDAMEFVGFLDISTDLAGNAPYLFKYKGAPEGVAITATDDFGNTSEFGVALGVIFGPNLTTGIEGDSVATVNTTKETHITVANRGTDLVESVQLTIEWTDNLSLMSLVNEATEQPVDCPGSPAVCAFGDMNPAELVRLRATFAVESDGPFELSAIADGVANAVPLTSNRSLLLGSVSVGVEGASIDEYERLATPYPNPFAESTSFVYNVFGLDEVRLNVFDLLGRRVRVLDLDSGYGEQIVRWDGTDDAGWPVPSGVYFVRLSSETQQITRTVVRAR